MIISATPSCIASGAVAYQAVIADCVRAFFVISPFVSVLDTASVRANLLVLITSCHNARAFFVSLSACGNDFILSCTESDLLLRTSLTVPVFVGRADWIFASVAQVFPIFVADFAHFAHNIRLAAFITLENAFCAFFSDRPVSTSD